MPALEPGLWGRGTPLTDSAHVPPANVPPTSPGVIPEVIALVGPSGTGKSHRASVVAHETGAQVILDDGLLIADGKILAGTSAKREPTRIAAIRRALLEDPAHASEIRRVLGRLLPDRILIIGISADMVKRVAANLGLPEPGRVISIEEIASPRQMRKARRIRASQGKHVIPAPTLEVRKSFAGYPVDPLKVFVKAREERPAPGQFIEKSVVRPTWSSLGRFYIEEVVLAAIAARAAADTGGVARVYQAKVEAREATVGFKLAIGVFYGSPIREVAGCAAREVTKMVEHMTGLTCERVEVEVTAVLPPRPTPRSPSTPPPTPSPTAQRPPAGMNTKP